jgi:hypothetical protein
MPRGKKVIEEQKPVKVVKKVLASVKEPDSDSDSESEYNKEFTPIANSVVELSKSAKPSVFISNTSLKSSDSDRIHLAQAINNFTLKSEQLMQEMKNFESFRESIARLDILIDTKKQEYKETNESLDLSHKTQVKKLESDYTEMTKKLKSEFDDLRKKTESDHVERSKKLESEFVDKKKALTNSYEDSQIDVKRKIAEDKSKQCELYAKELKMKYIKEDEHKVLLDQVQKALQDYNELKKSFDKQCDQVRLEESKKYITQLKNETTTQELTHKANNATLQAQVEQQKKEIQVLQQTIDSMKGEIREQRELTKEVAQASSKAQITQSIGKN